MSLRARVTFSIDETRKIFVIRYIGDLAGEQVYSEIFEHFQSVESPWLYDFLIDTTRHEGVIRSEDTEAAGKRWAALAQTRDSGRRIAVISTDPLIHARNNMRSEIFPHRTCEVFGTMEEAKEWLAAASSEPQT